MRKVFVKKSGGVSNRGGTVFIMTTLDNAKARLIPFVVSSSDSYYLEFTDEKIRVFQRGFYIDVEITSPYALADIPLIQYRQSGDIMI